MKIVTMRTIASVDRGEDRLQNQFRCFEISARRRLDDDRNWRLVGLRIAWSARRAWRGLVDRSQTTRDLRGEAVHRVAGVTRPERETTTQPAPQGQVHESANLPDVWRTERSVLCVAGRDPLDGVVASMLAQLRRKHGLGAQSALHGEVSRFAIKTLDTTDVALIFITYAELQGNPPHMRYLLRRIRQRFPLCPVLSDSGIPTRHCSGIRQRKKWRAPPHLRAHSATP